MNVPITATGATVLKKKQLVEVVKLDLLVIVFRSISILEVLESFDFLFHSICTGRCSISKNFKSCSQEASEIWTFVHFLFRFLAQMFFFFRLAFEIQYLTTDRDLRGFFFLLKLTQRNSCHLLNVSAAWAPFLGRRCCCCYSHCFRQTGKLNWCQKESEKKNTGKRKV